MLKIGEPDNLTAWHLDEPFWRARRVYGEGLFFIREAGEEVATARLLYAPVGEVELWSASRERRYSMTEDYVIEEGTRVVRLTAESRIPFMERAELYPAIGAEHCMAHKMGDEKVGLFFSEGNLFHDRAVEAFYEHESAWTGFVPGTQMDRLPGLAGKLKGTGELKICIVGDSISTGCNASAYLGVAPGMPPYYELWAAAMREQREGEVVLKNFAVSGTGMKYGRVTIAGAMDEKPDLVLIAYGMNEAGFITTEQYLEHATAVLETVRERGGATEVIFAASTLGNPEWAYAPVEKFLMFRDALAGLCGPGVALADLTSVWADMMKRKGYHDLTGNGVNHPNDFGHRVHAQVLLELLGIIPGHG